MICNMIQLPGGVFIDMNNISNFSVKQVADGIYSTYAESLNGGTFLFSDGWPSMDSAIACLNAFLGNLCPNFSWEVPPVTSALGSFCDFAVDLLPQEIKDVADGIKDLSFSEDTALGKISGSIVGTGGSIDSLYSVSGTNVSDLSASASASNLLTGTGGGLPSSLWETTSPEFNNTLRSSVNSSSSSIVDTTSSAWDSASNMIDTLTPSSSSSMLDGWIGL